MDNSIVSGGLKNFLSDGKLKAFPAKRKMKVLSLIFLSDKFDSARSYTESEVNNVIAENCCFDDFATLRRELCDFGFLSRDAYGKEYRVTVPAPQFPDLFPDLYP